MTASDSEARTASRVDACFKPGGIMDGGRLKGRLHRVRVCGAAVFLAAVLGGCATFAGHQDPINLADPHHTTTEHACPTSAMLDGYDRIQSKPLSERKLARNRAIDDCVDDADENFSVFVVSLREQSTGQNLAFGLASLGLSTSAALSSNAAATTLAGLSSGVAGAGAIVNKDLYYNETLPAILAAMVAHRTQVLLKIREGEQADPDAYTLSQARQDVRNYVAAGSIDDAIQQVTANSVATANANQATIDELRIGVLGTSLTTRTLIAWLFKDGNEIGADGKPADPIEKNWDKLDAWKNADEGDPDLRNIPLYQFIHVVDAKGRLEADRARAIADKSLAIPPLKN